MAGGAVRYRHLSRKSSHRKALLRNLVTSLIEHETITTTWAKAKEAQRLAEKLITLGKRNTNAAKMRAQSIFFTPPQHMPKLFTELRERYAERPGGYTRVLRTEPRNRHDDQAPTAILELVDGPKDMRFAMTAKTLERQRQSVEGVTKITHMNANKVTRYRQGGVEELEKAIRQIRLARDEERSTRRGEGGEEAPVML